VALEDVVAVVAPRHPTTPPRHSPVCDAFVTSVPLVQIATHSGKVLVNEQAPREGKSLSPAPSPRSTSPQNWKRPGSFRSPPSPAAGQMTSRGVVSPSIAPSGTTIYLPLSAGALAAKGSCSVLGHTSLIGRRATLSTLLLLRRWGICRTNTTWRAGVYTSFMEMNTPLQHHREAQAISKKALARASTVSRPTIIRAERGATPRYVNRRLLAAALRVPVGDLFPDA